MPIKYDSTAVPVRTIDWLKESTVYMETLRLSPMHARVRPDPIGPFIKYNLQTQTSWNFSGKHDRVCTRFVHCKLNTKVHTIDRAELHRIAS